MKLISLVALLALCFSNQASTSCEEELDGLTCDQIRDQAPVIYNRCCSTGANDRVPEDRDNVQIPGMADFEQIQNHITQGNISKEEGKILMARFSHGQAIIKWSLCRAGRSEAGQEVQLCGEKPKLEDFLNPPKLIKKPRRISRGDCTIEKGASRAKCGGKNYVEENPDQIGETHDSYGIGVIQSERDPLGDLTDILVDDGYITGDPDTGTVIDR